MRALRQAGVGAGIVASFLGTNFATAQQPSAREPAVRIARVRPAPESPVVRAQAGGTPMVPPGGTPPNPMANPMANPAGTPPVVGMPRPLPTNPMVTVDPTPPPVVPQYNGYPPGTVTPPVQPPPTYTYPPGQVPPAAGYPNGVPSTYPNGVMPTPAGTPLFPSYPQGPTGLPVNPAPPLLSAGPSPDMATPLYSQGAMGPAMLLGGPFATVAGQPGRWTANADLLLWWVKPAFAPALVTTSSPAFNGVPGQGDTRVLFGGGNLPTTMHTGGRFGGTYWFDACHTWGLDANFFFLGRNGKEYLANTDQFGLLARPFINANQGQAFSEIVAAPGLATGSVAVRYGTEMWGADANLRRSLVADCCSKLDIFAGYRMLRFADDIAITEQFARTPGSAAAVGVPTALFGTVSDSFQAVNTFHGVNMGLAGELRRGRWTLDGRASIALGTVFQSLDVAGNQQIQFADAAGRANGGLLALPGANIGRFGQEKFGALTEAGLKLSYDLTSRWKVGVGYNFLYLNSVIRASEQIDPVLDVNRIPNFPLPGTIPTLATVRPHVPLRTNDVFAQGVTFSVQYTW